MTEFALRDQISAAALAFATDAQPLAAIMAGIVGDVERASRERLEIFPVCHHSPASAVQMIRRLAHRPPRVIYMECCEDLQPMLHGLAQCTLPVAIQAFASSIKDLPAAQPPLNLVCPLTEFSAEFQAIAFCLNNPQTALVFVDRSVDHVFQWSTKGKSAAAADDDEAETSAKFHGDALAVELGASAPTVAVFTETLLRNARVQHYSEWWDQYVEEVAIGADTLLIARYSFSLAA